MVDDTIFLLAPTLARLALTQVQDQVPVGVEDALRNAQRDNLAGAKEGEKANQQRGSEGDATALHGMHGQSK